jgi:UDP:flavonoid glycosyltransferase YjiC (YdhE family)
MVNVVIVASGSRGEVQPYIALAIALQGHGHQVAIATETRMKSLVEQDFGLDYRYVAGDPTGLLWEPHAQKALKKGSLFELMSMTKEWECKYDRMDILQSYVSACEGAELIIGANLTLTQSYCVAEYMNCAWVPMILGPTFPTNEFPLWIVPPCLHCLPNKWFYKLVLKSLWNNEKKFINRWREEKLMLPPIKESSGIMSIIERKKPPVIIACSPLMCGPKKQVPKDYPSYVHLNGFAFVTTNDMDEKSVDLQLKKFVATASPKHLIYFGFGSMPAPHPEELIDIALGTCQQLGCKGVLVAGWSGIDSCEAMIEKAKDVLFITKSAPHDWLFPRVSCIVHHGGIGTTAAALRSGVPQIPCPVMLDQPHMAKVILGLGVAPDILPFSKLSVERLAPLLQLATNEATSAQYRQCAQTCAEQICLESSTCLELYCNLILDHVGSFQNQKLSTNNAPCNSVVSNDK